jgi:hypothetical protein
MFPRAGLNENRTLICAWSEEHSNSHIRVQMSIQAGQIFYNAQITTIDGEYYYLVHHRCYPYMDIVLPLRQSTKELNIGDQVDVMVDHVGDMDDGSHVAFVCLATAM